jgi:hypothetical protein
MEKYRPTACRSLLHLTLQKGKRQMSERQKPHNGRDTSGHHKVRQVDVDDLLADPNGSDYLRDDVRLGGAVEDTGLGAGEHGKRIEKLIEGSENL